VHGRTLAFVLAFAMTLGAQSAWTGLPPLLGNSAVSSKGSLAMIPVGFQNLGEVDGGTPIQAQVQVMNVGTAAFTVFAPFAGGIAKIRVQFPGSGDLVLAPGDVVVIPVEYDARLDSGPTGFEVNLRSNDPEAPILRQAFQIVVRKALVASPYRDCIQGQTGNPAASQTIPLFFTSDGRLHFQGLSIEDETAPLRVTGAVTPRGDYTGTVSLDWSRIQEGKGPKRGETRIFGLTDAGRRTYTWVQWVVD